MQRNILVRVVIPPVAALFLASCSKPSAAVVPALQTVTAGVAEEIQPDIPERYTASIAPFAQVDLAFKSAGIIDRIHQVSGADGRVRNVEPGDRVNKDTELAQVRPLDYQHRLDGAEAQRAQSQAQVAQAQAQLAQARANFSEAEIEYQRASNLFQSASLVKPQFDQAKGRYESMRAAVSAAEAVVKAAEAGVANASAAVSDANLSLSDTSLRAPFAGWITARNVDRGSIVGSAVVGFSMIDTHAVKAVFAVPDTSLPQIHLGRRQAVMLDALGHASPGVVTAISPQADPKSRVFSIEVTLDNPREEIRPGMIGSLELGSLTLGTAHGLAPRLVVPLGAVVRAPADPQGFAVMCLVQRDGKTYASAQVIEIGQTFGNSIEVMRGLRAGQRLIAVGGSLVHDGQEVRVLP
jgi:multidrug efflux system membrane fusion protein